MSSSLVAETLPVMQCDNGPHCGLAEGALAARARRPYEWAKHLTGSEAGIASGEYLRVLRDGRHQLAGWFSEAEVAELAGALGCRVFCRDLLLELPNAYADGRTARGKRVNSGLMSKLATMTMAMSGALLQVLEWAWLDGCPSGLTYRESCDHCGLQLADEVDQ